MTDVTTPPETLAVAVAPEPFASVMLTAGAAVYPEPPLTTVTLTRNPLTTEAVAVAWTPEFWVPPLTSANLNRPMPLKLVPFALTRP